MEWRVARSLNVLLGQFNAYSPDRSKISDGSIGDAAHASRASDHNPWYGPGIVTARDFTHDPLHGMDIDKITDELAASRDPRIKYIIANGLIMDSRPGMNPWKWVRYTGPNQHTKHFHLSVLATPLCDDIAPWNLPMFVKTTATAPPATPAQAVVRKEEEEMVIVTVAQTGDKPSHAGLLMGNGLPLIDITDDTVARHSAQLLIQAKTSQELTVSHTTWDRMLGSAT